MQIEGTESVRGRPLLGSISKALHDFALESFSKLISEPQFSIWLLKNDIKTLSKIWAVICKPIVFLFRLVCGARAACCLLGIVSTPLFLEATATPAGGQMFVDASVAVDLQFALRPKGEAASLIRGGTKVDVWVWQASLSDRLCAWLEVCACPSNQKRAPLVAGWHP